MSGTVNEKLDHIIKLLEREGPLPEDIEAHCEVLLERDGDLEMLCDELGEVLASCDEDGSAVSEDEVGRWVATVREVRQALMDVRAVLLEAVER